jgi:hypothetical protein
MGQFAVPIGVCFATKSELKLRFAYLLNIKRDGAKTDYINS